MEDALRNFRCSLGCSRATEESLKVIYNTGDALDLSENGPAHDKKAVAKIVLHPDFYSGGLYNDVALLVLESAIELKGLVNSICLPRQGETFNSTHCWAAGWGDTGSMANGKGCFD